MELETFSELELFSRGAGTVHRSEKGDTANQGWGAIALVAYGKALAGETENELETILADLLGDLMHLADAIGADWEYALETADMNYRAEKNGE